jgi:hypothetical protein
MCPLLQSLFNFPFDLERMSRIDKAVNEAREVIRGELFGFAVTAFLGLSERLLMSCTMPKLSVVRSRGIIYCAPRG